MAYALVQSRSLQVDNAGSAALAFNSNVTAGSLLVVAGSSWGLGWGVSGCSDTQTNTYTRDEEQAASVAQLGIYSAPNAAGGACTVTLNPDGTTEDISIAIHEYSGMATASAKDQNASATGTSGTHSCGTTGTTTQADELVFIASTHAGATGAVSASGFTVREQQTSNADMPLATADKRVTATGTQTGSFTWVNANYAAAIVTYKEAAAAGGDAVPVCWAQYRTRRV